MAQNQTINSLTNLVASNDAMTYAALQQSTAAVDEVEPYVPKDDESEAAQWEGLVGNDGDYDDDLRELGLRA